MRILLVEDSVRLKELLCEELQRAGFLADAAATSAEFAELSRARAHDLYIVDLGLPDGSGLDIIADLRRQGDPTPVLVVTGQSQVSSRVEGLNRGADDYLVKPFHRDELVARVRALLRRPQAIRQAEHRLGGLVVDAETGDARCEGRRVELTPAERRLLLLLAQRSGATVSRQLILDTISGIGSDISPNAIDKLASRLRHKLADIPAGVRLRTVKGDGYSLEVSSE